MTKSEICEIHDCALEVLERLEYESLSWGYVDGSFSESEAEKAIACEFCKYKIDYDPADALDELVEANLVRLWYQPDRRYRTRLGEIVRLLVRLRQLFEGRDWQTSPSLVSDFRIDIRKRATPRPEIDPRSVFAELSENIRLTALQQKLWTTLVDADSGFKLRKFQIDVAKRVFGNSGEIGTIVTAGTGSGKTLAFYLPVLTQIGEMIRPGEAWTKTLCIYPRKELLKDQFSEVYKLTRKVKSVLRKSNRRTYSLGALFGETPSKPTNFGLENANWNKKSAGFICPFLHCPDCEGEMIWRHIDIKKRIEKLHCTRPDCNFSTDKDEISLSRSALLHTPPDILFTTTEMINQRLSDTRYREFFGVDSPSQNRLKFVLLDEVHTYSGTSGAQTALLLRRFKHFLGFKVGWIGLSATLKEASVFFSELCGLQSDQVAEVSPNRNDLDETGAEYQLLVRSNPASQTATLSTSIQALMLISRMLDPINENLSYDRFGQRLFAFTDDLDVTHRLYDNLHDAEGYDRWGKPDTDRLPLAALRSDNLPDSEAREQDGQRWAFAENQISLDRRLKISRTTSRAPGVDNSANVIVATSALEVGFNDPEVGAVLQHKAPRSPAAFLQRRGRAGRKLNMRPLTVTVLSDYGRDRMAFQSFEYMFDPVLERQSLPIRNSYILRMQAVFSTLDWITGQVASLGGEGWAWATLSQPSKDPLQPSDYGTKARRIIKSIVKFDQTVIDDLSKHLKDSLMISQEELNSILWYPPRSLILEVIPTLYRRLICNWKLTDGTGFDLTVPYHPLPDFIPRNLFSDLNLPEVTIKVPAATRHVESKDEQLPIFQALNQFVPGRVRRRFADEYGDLAHWVPVPDQDEYVAISIDDYVPLREYVGSEKVMMNNDKVAMDIYRPWNIKVEKTPMNILHTSHGIWMWRSSFETVGKPYEVKLPERSFWSRSLSQLEFFLHRFSSAVRQRRFASEGEAELRRRSGHSRVNFHLVDGDDNPVAVGFELDADTLVLPLNLPNYEEISSIEISGSLANWLRTLHFRHAVLKDKKIPDTVNSFQRDWLYQIFLLHVVRTAELEGIAIEERIVKLNSISDTASIDHDIAAIVNSEVSDEGEYLETRLFLTLQEILTQPGVIRRLSDLILQSSRLDEEEWVDWINQILRNTMAEATLRACYIASPSNTFLDSLTVDLVKKGSGYAAYISESTLGGGGTIEALAIYFSADPRAYLGALEAALSPSDLEVAADSLEIVYRLAISDKEVKESLENLRLADRVENRTREKDRFFELLCERGVRLSHALSVSIATRLLSPNASAESDELIVKLLDELNAVENRAKFCLPVRVAAATLGSLEDLGNQLKSIGGNTTTSTAVANLLLWSRGSELRQMPLQSYNPYRQNSITDTQLAYVLLLENQVETIRLLEVDWESRLHRALVRNGEAILCASANQIEQLRAEVIRLISKPIETEYLQLFPCLSGIYKEEDNWSAELFVRELG